MLPLSMPNSIAGRRVLALMTVGFSVQDACSAAKLDRSTVYRWVKDGRHPDASPELRAFATRFDLLVHGPQGDSPSDQDLLRLLEARARRGNVEAIRYLLERVPP